MSAIGPNGPFMVRLGADGRPILGFGPQGQPATHHWRWSEAHTIDGPTMPNTPATGRGHERTTDDTRFPHARGTVPTPATRRHRHESAHRHGPDPCRGRHHRKPVLTRGNGHAVSATRSAARAVLGCPDVAVAVVSRVSRTFRCELPLLEGERDFCLTRPVRSSCPQVWMVLWTSGEIRGRRR